MRRLIFALSLCACAQDLPGRANGIALPPNATAVQPSADPSGAVIAGGTLLASARDPSRAFAANPDADVIDVVDLSSHAITWRAFLESGSEPGRMVEDDDGLLHVALRRGGKVATLDPSASTIVTRTACPSPRGIAVTADDIIVACEGGELVFLSRRSSDRRVVALTRDLRDIVVQDDGNIAVTHFRSAEISLLDRWGSPIGTMRPPPIVLNGLERFVPHVAWRALRGPDGAVYVLHQYETTRALPTTASSQSLPYGAIPPSAPSPCDGRPIMTGVTRFSSAGSSTVIVAFAAPAMDFAFSGTKIAIAGGGGYNASIAYLDTRDFSEWPSCVESDNVYLTTPVVAVSYTTDGLLVQTRDDATLRRFTFDSPDGEQGAWSIDLTPTASDPGRALFHGSTRVGFACASCHPEGTDDGHVWNLIFERDFNHSTVSRRTPSLRGGLLATAPFHWDGDLRDMTALVNDVFTQRMGGPMMSGKASTALGAWLNTLPSLPPPSTLDAGAISRGSSRFLGAGCVACHSGPHMTSNQTTDVGRGAFQVPSLLGVGARAPYMHDGCAPDLMARLRDPKCAGDTHGNTSALSSADLLDLETYLESL